MVIKANTVIHPWTVMIKAFNTFVTDTAVARAISSDYFTVRAK